MEPFIGMIVMFGGNFAPRGWALCDGQLLQIAQNTALFSILGTTYGGDGRITFGLPDLRSRVPMHAGTGPGLSPRTLGQRGGQENVTLTAAELPSHNHLASGTQNVLDGAGDSSNPAGRVPAQLVRETAYSASSANAQLLADSVDVTVQNAGGSQPHDNMPPYQVINFIIALEGIFPSRS
jgi:microcystin-dependent protein